MKKLTLCNSKFYWVAIIIGILTAVSVSSKAQNYSFKVEKTGNGQDILLIPGVTCSGDVWNQTVSELSQNYKCHVVTLPGFAGQPAIDVSNGFTSKMTEELLSYVMDNKLKNPIVIGHSLGGFLALDMMSIKPDLFEKGIIVDGLPFLATIMNPMATEESMKQVAKGMIAAGNNQTPDQFMAQQRQILGSMITDEVNIETALNWGAASDKATIDQAMYDLYTTDLRDDISKIKTRVLVLGAYIAYKNFGVTKEMTLANFTSQYQKLEGVQIELSDIGKHFIMWDDPTFFLSQTNAFLSGKEARL